jgi:hypothetical protein
MKHAFSLAAYPAASETCVVRQISKMIFLGHDVTVATGFHDKGIPCV